MWRPSGRSMNSSSSEDMADSVRGKGKALGAQVECQSPSSVGGLAPSLQGLLLDVRRSMPWGAVRASGVVLQARPALGRIASEPVSDHLSRVCQRGAVSRVLPVY
jgi:hypothetical protein